MTDRRASGLLLFGSLLLAVGYHAPALLALDATGFGDWQQIHRAWEVGVAALSRSGEWPLWDPHHCGGVTMFGNPESQHFGPFFPLALVVSSTRVLKLALVAHAWLGLVGAYLFARREHGLGRLGASVAAVGFSMSGFFAWQMAGGHFTFVGFYLAPFILLAFRRAIDDLRYVAALSLLLALVVVQGGTYPFPYLVLLLAFDAIVVWLRSRAGLVDRGRRVLAVGVATALLTGLLGSIRFFPIVHTLDLYPRVMPSDDRMFLREMVDVWTTYDFPWRHPDHPFVWNEYTAFVGWPMFALGLAGVLAALRRRRLAPIAGLALFVGLMLGNRGPHAPWELLHELPVYESLRVPSRFSVLATFYLALLAGIAIDEIRRAVGRIGRPRAPRPLSTIATALAFLLVAGPAVAFGVVTHDRWKGPVLTGEPERRFHLVWPRDYDADVASLPRRNQGTPACYVGNMNWRVSRRLWVGDVEQARVSRGEGTVGASGRTNHGAWATVRMQSAGRVLFNQNFHPDWVVSEGAARVVDEDGLVAADVPAGDQRVELRYEPATFFYAVTLSLLGLVVSGLVWLACPKRPHRR